MRACALKVSKIERWKTTTHVVKCLIEEIRLDVFDLKMFTYGNLCMESIDNMLYIFLVFFRLSFNGKNIHVKQNFLCEIEGIKWLVKSQQQRFRKYS